MVATPILSLKPIFLLQNKFEKMLRRVLALKTCSAKHLITKSGSASCISTTHQLTQFSLSQGQVRSYATEQREKKAKSKNGRESSSQKLCK